MPDIRQLHFDFNTLRNAYESAIRERVEADIRLRIAEDEAFRALNTFIAKLIDAQKKGE